MIIRVDSLLGGSIDSILELQALGLDEEVCKMSLENYHDMKECPFNRCKLGAQNLLEDNNNKLSNQESLKNQSISKNNCKVFRVAGRYSKEDRTCRHTAQDIVQALMCLSYDVNSTFTIT